MGWLGLKKGVTFGEKHSYTDYGLYMASRPEITAPEPKRMVVDIPGMDGVLDLTEANVGETKYENRTLTLRFSALVEIEDSAALKQQLLNDIHGKKLVVTLDEDSEYYYFGRCSVAFENETPLKLNVVVTVDAEPFKYEHEPTEIKILPDGFDDVYVSLGGTYEEWLQDHYWNTELYFGSQAFPEGDFRAFTTLRLTWPPEGHIIADWGVSIDVVDSSLNSKTFVEGTDFDAGSVFFDMPVSALTAAGVDVSKIWRIRILKRGGGSLTGIAENAIETTIINGRMTVIPEFESPDSPLTILLNGKSHTVGSGKYKYPDVYLTEGENTLIIHGIYNNLRRPIYIRFRRGWL